MLVKKFFLVDFFYCIFIYCIVIGVIENVLQLVCNYLEFKFYWVGGIDSYLLCDLEDLYVFS